MPGLGHELIAALAANSCAVSLDLGPVFWFLRRVRRADVAELGKIIEEAARALGFSFYALVHHGQGARAERGPMPLVNYPQAWRDYYVRNELQRVDPVLRACDRALVGFRWSQLGKLIAMRPEHHLVIDASRRHGLGAGFTVPLHVPGEHVACCSFVVERDAPLPAHNLIAAQLLGQFAFEVSRSFGLGRATTPRLTPRQREAVQLVAQGQTDKGIARELKLSEETVTKYLNAARRRYGLSRRAQLVAAALFHGDIGFSDVFPV